MKKVNFIHTPKDWNELQNRIESLTGPGESTLATLFAGMAWNMAVDTSGRDTSGRDTSGRPPKKLNGYNVIAFAPCQPLDFKNFVVLIHLGDNSLTPFCAAHWNVAAGDGWNAGDYCETYAAAFEAYIIRASADRLVAI